MNRIDIQKIYTDRKAVHESQLGATNRKINLISNVRLATAFAIIISFYYSFGYPAAFLATLALIVLFLYLIQRHGALFQERVHLQNLVQANTQELRALDNNLTGFDPGLRFIDPSHPFSHDLDIFGEGSLFQYINRCNTIHGKARMAQSLEETFRSKEEVTQLQDCIRELKGKIDFRQHTQAASMEAGEQEGDHEQLLAWLDHPSLIGTGSATRWMLILIPLATLISLACSFFITEFKIPLFILIIIQWIITGTRLKKINAFHDYISRKKNILQKYSRLLLYVEKETFQSPRLSFLSGQAHEAHENITRLASLVNALDARTNALMTFFVNSLLLYDMQCVFRLEKWKEHHADHLPLWLKTIEEIEVLNSFATFAYNHPAFQFATITEELTITATSLAHPILREEERVVNDVTIGKRSSILIITGANMAGKSTFLRTVGINLVLALNGAPVCAQEFSCPPVNMRSGMRTADSLKDHQSYFYAELNRLKTIMDELREDRPLLILLDEILKGTNSNDKQAGSIALVRQLLPHPCLALIATHDLALGDLEEEFPDKIRNYCFEANIENDQLSFDYKLKHGIAQKMNASFLMKKMGIIP